MSKRVFELSYVIAFIIVLNFINKKIQFMWAENLSAPPAAWGLVRQGNILPCECIFVTELDNRKKARQFFCLWITNAFRTFPNYKMRVLISDFRLARPPAFCGILMIFWTQKVSPPPEKNGTKSYVTLIVSPRGEFHLWVEFAHVFGQTYFSVYMSLMKTRVKLIPGVIQYDFNA